MAKTDVIQILSDLIRTGSVNPAYDSQSSEAAIQGEISSYFRRHGIQTCEQGVLDGRSNVIAKLAGRNSTRRIVFEAHCDTAGIDGMRIQPFDPQIRNGRIYGRGACDTKAGLAAMMLAIVDLKRANMQPPCEVWVASTVDEEHAYRGVLKLCENLEAAAAVVSEPTDMKMAVASKGCLRWRISIKGRTAHSSKPELGTNAIVQMAWIIRFLEDHSRQLQESRHPFVGSPTLNIGLIQGGTQVNNVPDACWIEIDLSFDSRGGTQAHTAEEYVELEEVEKAFVVYRDLMKSFE